MNRAVPTHAGASFARALACAALAASAACGLFDDARCDSDADCPADVPFCVDGFCDADAPPGEGEGEGGEGEGEGEGGEGEGEGGEGEGEAAAPACDETAACAAGVCCTDAAACGARAETCVGAANDACAAAGDPPAREQGGPAIFDVVVVSTGPCSPDGAGVRVDVRYVDAEGDMWLIDDGRPALFVQTAAFPGFPLAFQAGQVSAQDGDRSAGAFTVFGCVQALDDALAVWIEDGGARASNVVCAGP